ncbi:hypothetical protein JCM14076_02010 [Methylosoma difficile]
MNKNTYTRLILVACMAVASAPLLADVAVGTGQSADSAHRKSVAEEEERSGHVGYSGFEQKAAGAEHPANNTALTAHSKDAGKPSAEEAHRKFVAEEEERSGHIGYSGFEENKAVANTK